MAALLLLFIAAFLVWQNEALIVEEYAVESPALPEELDGCKIVQLSDLHNKRFGEDQKRLIAELEKISPDLILITGDLIDKRRTKEDEWSNALSLVRQAAELAPVFYVSGNHEWESGLYKKLRPQLETLGAEVLDDGFVVLDHGEAALSVMGLSDPAAFSKSVKSGGTMQEEEREACERKVEERLQWLSGQQEEAAFQVLIAHRPQLLERYAQAGVHLAFCGHAHGGQVRLPGIGALYAPNQGWRPKFTEGAHIEGDTVMIVSRGLGNSAFPVRLFNRPQIVVVTLCTPKEEAEDNLLVPEEEIGMAAPIAEEIPGDAEEAIPEFVIDENTEEPEPEPEPVDAVSEIEPEAEGGESEELPLDFTEEPLDTDEEQPDPDKAPLEFLIDDSAPIVMPDTQEMGQDALEEEPMAVQEEPEEKPKLSGFAQVGPEELEAFRAFEEAVESEEPLGRAGWEEPSAEPFGPEEQGIVPEADNVSSAGVPSEDVSLPLDESEEKTPEETYPDDLMLGAFPAMNELPDELPEETKV